MSTGNLDHALMQEIEALQEEGRAKAPERIIVDYTPAAGEKGPRYILKGLNRQFHPDSCVKGSAGSKSNFLSSYHRSQGGIAIRFARHYRELVKALEALPFVKPQEYTYAFIQDSYVSGTLSLMGVFKGWEQADVSYFLRLFSPTFLAQHSP